jgi:hypothetical protein
MADSANLWASRRARRHHARTEYNPLRMTRANDRTAFPRLSVPRVVLTSALALVTFACSPKTPPPTAARPPSPAAVASAPRPETAPPLTGLTTRAAIESFNDQWRTLRAADYTPDAAAVATIRARSKDVTAFIVLGTWCPDTHRELPRFFKIADQAGWPTSRMTLLAVDRTKQDGGGETVKWNVTRVPTFIFLRAGKEIGRVTERPITTLEQDIATILDKD